MTLAGRFWCFFGRHQITFDTQQSAIKAIHEMIKLGFPKEKQYQLVPCMHCKTEIKIL